MPGKAACVWAQEHAWERRCDTEAREKGYSVNDPQKVTEGLSCSPLFCPLRDRPQGKNGVPPGPSVSSPQ